MYTFTTQLIFLLCRGCGYEKKVCVYDDDYNNICGDISWTLVGRVICINIVYVYVFVYRDRGRGMRVAGSTIDHW